VPLRSIRRRSTRHLVRGDHRLLMVGQGRRRLWLLALGLPLLVGALWFAERREQAAELAALREENRQLKASLEESRLLHREAQAAERQLVRRNAELSARVKRLSTELAFFRKQKDNP